MTYIYIYIFNYIYIWLVVYLPPWKIWKSVGMMKFPIHGKTKNVPNHQLPFSIAMWVYRRVYYMYIYTPDHGLCSWRSSMPCRIIDNGDILYGTPDWQRGRRVQMGCNVLQCEVWQRPKKTFCGWLINFIKIYATSTAIGTQGSFYPTMWYIDGTHD